MSIKSFFNKIFRKSKDDKIDPNNYLVTQAVDPKKIDDQTKQKDLEKLMSLEQNISKIKVDSSRIAQDQKSESVSAIVKNPFTGE